MSKVRSVFKTFFHAGVSVFTCAFVYLLSTNVAARAIGWDFFQCNFPINFGAPNQFYIQYRL